MIKYRCKVKIIRGFYVGWEGIVTEEIESLSLEPSPATYKVTLLDMHVALISGTDLRVIKESNDD